MNNLYVMCGFPGAGKSTYFNGKEMALSNNVILSSDDFRHVLTGQAWHAPAEEMVWSHMKICARILLQGGHDVYIDSINLTVKDRAQWIEMAKELSVSITCIYLNVSFETCLVRNGARDRVVPDEVMHKMKCKFITPKTSEGFNRLETHHIY